MLARLLHHARSFSLLFLCWLSGRPIRQSPAADSSGRLFRSRPYAGRNGALSQAQMQQLFRVVADKDRDNQKRQRDYTYIEREVQNKLDGKGQTKSAEVKTYEILEIYGEQVQRLIEKGRQAARRQGRGQGRREDPEDHRQAQERIGGRPQEARREGRKRARGWPQVREGNRRRLQLQTGRTEVVGGREAWVIDGEPRPGYEPQMKEAKFLPKFHGRVWIDKGDLQLAKMDIEAIDTVSVGWVLARIHKGSRFMLEQTRVNDEVWLPRHVTFKFDARVALFKGYNIDGDQEYRDYKKFGTTSKIVGMGEVKEH